MTPVSDQITKLQIALPKLISPFVGVFFGLIVTWAARHGITIGEDWRGAFTDAVFSVTTLVVTGLSSLLIASRTNPAGVTSTSAIVPSATPGKPNVTSEPVDTNTPPRASL